MAVKSKLSRLFTAGTSCTSAVDMSRFGASDNALFKRRAWQLRNCSLYVPLTQEITLSHV
jgi:hypothetical protein